ncbi:MAG: phosphonopyruvate decarboxylase [Gammaproteobacteria bacterium]|nr:phosphonopyruvate decarboxylase [Gammaproteobacteria bacterium]
MASSPGPASVWRHGSGECRRHSTFIRGSYVATAEKIDWHKDIFDVLREQDISLVAHVPDAGHTPLIKRCEAHNDIDVVTLTTEEDGVGLLCGAWAGGRKGVLLMQSSGVGNCGNALALPAIGRIPFVTLVSMRGEWGEFIPWQVPMGRGTPGLLEAMDVRVFRADHQAEVGSTVDAAIKLAFNTRQSTAVLLSQRMIGAKQFKEG